MQSSRCALAAAVFGSFFAVAATSRAVENWPRFRGPTGQGVSAAKDLPLHWSGTENVAWKTEIPGDGWSSPIVFGDRIFMTSTTELGKFCHVICVDRKSGQLLWDKQVFEQNPGPRRPDNSFASPTPVTDGSLVYAVFSSGGIAALDYEGNVRLGEPRNCISQPAWIGHVADSDRQAFDHALRRHPPARRLRDAVGRRGRAGRG